MPTKGRWQEGTFAARPGDEIAVANASHLKEGHMKLIHVNSRRIALARTGTGFHAVDDGCSHRGGSRAGGVLIGDTVQCLWHGSQFDVKTGKAPCGPAEKGSPRSRFASIRARFCSRSRNSSKPERHRSRPIARSRTGNPEDRGFSAVRIWDGTGRCRSAESTIRSGYTF